MFAGALLVTLAALAAGDCGGDGAVDCCVPGPEGVGGCSDPVCCATVCDIDSFCCDTWWDSTCVELAAINCNADSDYCGPCQGDGSIFSVPSVYPDINTAISAACSGDVVLVAPGTYRELVDFQGKSIELRSESGPGVTIIDADFSGSCVNVIDVSGGGASVRGFTLRNGVGNSSIFWSYGGGIFCNRSEFAAHDCIIEDNAIEFGDGAAVWVSRESSMTIEGCIIRNNAIRYGYKGGGLYARGDSEVFIRDTVFLNNTAVQGAAGGIYTEGGILEIVGGSFEGCVSGSAGGAIECLGGSLHLEDVEFIDNRGGSFGAGVHAGGADPLLIRGCLFSGNEGGSYGGALHLAGSTFDRQILDSIFTDNFVTSDGAGLQINGGGGLVRGCTFLGNTCLGRGGGIKVADGAVSVRDCLFIDNHANDDGGGLDVTTGEQAIVIVGNSFLGNHAGQYRFGEPVGGRGGGLRVSAVRPQIVSNLLVGNYTYDHGGGILVENAASDAVIANLLVVGSVAGWSGAGMHLQNSSAPVHNCTVVGNYSGERFGGIRAGGPLHNCIVRNNRAKNELQVGTDHASLELINSNIQGRPDSVGPDRAVDFGDPVGADPFVFDGDEDFGLTDCAHVLELGRSDLLPRDTVDLDEDGDFDEPLPLDLAGNPRVVGQLDLGAYELPAEGRPCSPLSDCDGNGIDDAIDIAECDGTPGCLDCNLNGRPDRCDLEPSAPIVDAGSAYWRFEDPDAPERDSGMANLEGLLRNASLSTDVPVSVVPATGLPNTASLRFDGVGRIVTDQYNAFTSFARNRCTIEAWVRLEELATGNNAGSRQYLVMKKEVASSDDETEYSFLVQAGNIRQGANPVYGKTSGYSGRELAVMFGGCTDRWVAISSLEINDSDWHHVSVAIDHPGEKIRFGIDGVFDEFAIEDRGVCDRIAPLYIGSRRNADDVFNQNLVGLVDELRMTHGYRETWSLLNMPPPGASGDCNGNGLPDDCDIASGLLEDLDRDGIPDDCGNDVCPGDLDGDGIVDGGDLTDLLARWGESDPDADLDGNGTVDGADLNALLGAWGACP